MGNFVGMEKLFTRIQTFTAMASKSNYGEFFIILFSDIKYFQWTSLIIKLTDEITTQLNTWNGKCYNALSISNPKIESSSKSK